LRMLESKRKIFGVHIFGVQTQQRLPKSSLRISSVLLLISCWLIRAYPR